MKKLLLISLIMVLITYYKIEAFAADNVRKEYYPNGKLKVECPVVNGLFHGVFK